MEASRSLLWQMGYNVPFGFLILFTMGTVVDGEHTNTTTPLASSVGQDTSNATGRPLTTIVPTTMKGAVSSTGVQVKGQHTTRPSPTLPSESSAPASITPDSNGTNAASKVITKKMPPKTKPSVLPAKVVGTTTSVATPPAAHPVASTASNTSDSVTSSGKAIVASTPSPQKIPEKIPDVKKDSAGTAAPVTSGALLDQRVASTGTAMTAKGSRGRVTSLKPSEEPDPEQTEEETHTPRHRNLGDVTAHVASSRSPSVSIKELPTTKAPGPPAGKAPKPSTTEGTKSVPSGTSSSGKSYTGIILAVVLSILFIVAVAALLYVWRRRRSGSTDLSAGWAGQAALPDDAGLDRDVEEGEVGAREGEARRSTLVTFFGKRQSRTPSITMEDMGGKGGREETQQLLDGGAGGDPNPEGSEEANGELKEATKPSSQEASTASKPGGDASS